MKNEIHTKKKFEQKIEKNSKTLKKEIEKFEQKIEKKKYCEIEKIEKEKF